MSDMGFENLLAEHNAAFAEAEAYSNWMPPDAEYIVMLTSVGTGKFEDKASGKDIPYWRVKGKILEEGSPMDGQEFVVGFYTGRAYGIFKSAVGILKGEVVTDLIVANKFMVEEVVGMVVRVKVDTTNRKGQEYRNATILEKLQATEEVQEVPEAPIDPPEAPAEA